MKTLEGINTELGKRFIVNLKGDVEVGECTGELEGCVFLLVSQEEDLEARKKILENTDCLGCPWEEDRFAFVYRDSWKFTLDGEVLVP